MFFLIKKKRGKTRPETVAYTVLCPRRLTPHPQILAGAHYFPPHLSGLPPDPVPPLRLQCLTLERRALPKLGDAGDLLIAVAPGRRLWEAGRTRSAGRADAVA